MASSKRFKRVLLSVLIGFGLVIGLAYGIGLYLQSSYLRTQVLPKAISYIESHYPVKISIGDLRLSLFKGLIVSNTALQLKTDFNQSAVKIGEIRVRYSPLSLLSKKIIIDSIALNHIEVDASLSPSGAKPKKSSPLPSELLKNISKNLQSIPVEIRIDEFKIESLRIHAVVSQANHKIEVSLPSVNLLASLSIHRGKLQLESKLKSWQSDNYVKASLSKMEYSLMPSISLETSLAVTSVPDAPSLIALKKLDAKYDLEQIRLSPSLKDLRLSGSIEAEHGSGKGLLKSELSLNEIPIVHKKVEWRIDQVPLQLKGQANVALTEKLSKEYPKLEPLFKNGDVNLEGHLELSAQQSFLSLLDGLASSKVPLLDFKHQVAITMKPIQAHLKTLGHLKPELDDLSFTGEAKIQTHPDWNSSQLKAQGEISVPWTFKRIRGKTFLVSASFNAQDFSLEHKDLSLQKLNSKIPLSFELLWKGGRALSLSYLIDRNPFERVDYSNIKPYVSSSFTNLKFEKFRFKNYEVGPLFADVALNQNLILANQYQIKLLDGMAAGSFFVDLNPNDYRVGVLGRVVGINPKVLTGKISRAEDKRLSSRLALIYNFEHSSAEGRMDITEIGGPQLIEMINVLDPQYKDSKMNLARSLLKVAHPRYVGLQMSQGFLNLNLDMGGLVSISNLGIDGVPLTPVLAMMKQDLITKLKTGAQK